MVILSQGLSKLADEFKDLITEGQWGSGTVLPTTSDTGLGSAFPETLGSVNVASSGNGAQFTHTVVSTTGNTTGYAEFALNYSDGTEFNRVVGGTFNKTNSYEIVTITTINFVPNN
jgi:hypothetical protein